MKLEVDQLTESRRNIDHALAQTERPLRVYSKCKENRERRIGIDRVKDSVEKSLQQEHESIIQHQDIMKELVEQSSMQLDSNTAALDLLSCDLTNKDEAISINRATMAVNKPGKTFNKEPAYDKTMFTDASNLPGRRTQQWAKMTQKNVQASQYCRAESQKLRGKINSICNQAVAEIKSAWTATNTSLHARIKETEETQKKLQQHLNKTLGELRDQEKHIEQLRAAVRNKGQPLKIAQARLAMRTKLPGDEACLDLPHIMLLEEVGQIEESIATLTATLEQAQSVHSDLLQVKQSLEHDIFIKTNSLVIDRSKCLPLRTEFPFHLWCGCKKCKTCRTSLYCRTHTCRQVKNSREIK